MSISYEIDLLIDIVLDFIMLKCCKCQSIMHEAIVKAILVLHSPILKKEAYSYNFMKGNRVREILPFPLPRGPGSSRGRVLGENL